MKELSLNVKYVDENYSMAIVSLFNTLDIENMYYIKDFLTSLIEKGKNDIILDFSNVEYVEKSAWDMIINMRKDVYFKGGDIIIANIYGFVKNEYILMELSSVIPSYANFEEAFYSFGISFDIKYA